MRTTFRKLVLSALLSGFLAVPLAAAKDGFSFGPFGALNIYRPKGAPTNVILFVSGDYGWNLGVLDMAREFVSTGALVVGIDITKYLKTIGAKSEHCTYSAAHFEELSKVVQKREGIPKYLSPTLIGYSSGATLVYAVMAQAPTNTFRGAVSMGFCPILTLKKPLCKQQALSWESGKKKNEYIFHPSSKLENPWYVLHGDADQICAIGATKSFVESTSAAHIVSLPKVGHGFSVQKNWMPQLKKVIEDLVIVQKEAPLGDSDVANLPLVEVVSAEPSGNSFAVLVSGDGGWAGIDKRIAEFLSKFGINVVGWDSLRYFWNAKDPVTASKDLDRVIRHFSTKWKRTQVLLIGFSLGADVLPFMVNGLPQETRERILKVALLGVSKSAKFEFHLTDWIGGSDTNKTLPVLPEVKKMAPTPVLCIFGTKEKESLCRYMSKEIAKVFELDGGHYFGGDYQKIAKIIHEESNNK